MAFLVFTFPVDQMQFFPPLSFSHVLCLQLHAALLQTGCAAFTKFPNHVMCFSAAKLNTEIKLYGR